MKNFLDILLAGLLYVGTFIFMFIVTLFMFWPFVAFILIFCVLFWILLPVLGWIVFILLMIFISIYIILNIVEG